MRLSFLRIGLAATIAVTACSKDDESTPAPQRLVVTVDPGVLPADGTSTLAVQVEGATRAPITVTTTRGLFVATNDTEITINGLGGTVELRACDGALPGCVGNAYVNATDAAALNGYATVRFTGVEICTNGVDDNANGLADCADLAACTARACTTTAGGTGQCTAAGACVCTGTATTETSCTDGTDEDCDGDTDCADSDCTAVTCTAPGGGIGQCTAAGACVCTVETASEVTCNDGRDNDCDGSVDCAEASCDTRACTSGTAPGTCQQGACVPAACSSTATTETACSGGVDEDCDGALDCADSDCDGLSCGATPSLLCQAGACTDVATGYAFALAPARIRLPAVAGSSTDVVVSVLRDGEPIAGVTVTLATTLGSLSSTSVTTDAEGLAVVTFTGTAAGGRAVITGTIASPPLQAVATIDLPALGSVALEGQGVEYPVMGVANSGWREQNNVVVKLRDANGEPYPAGLQVRFEHRALAGSRITGPALNDAACAAPCMYQLAVTDDQGLARIILYSGTAAGTLELTASATAGGEFRRLTLPGVSAIGARANAGAFTIVCDPLNNPGLQFHNCGVSLYEGQYTCVAVLQDRFQNMLGTATPVTFVSETSRIGQVATTPAFNPSGGSGQAGLGQASQIFQLLGGYLPEDVAPVAGEPSSTYVDLCSAPGTRTHNPRDGIVAVVAVVDGEESFTDLDGDGVYDAGEPFIDLAEPFADYDDDGVQGPGEWFQDVNGNGSWDGPNGAWDPFTKIWTQTAIVYSGGPAANLPAGANLLGSRWVEPASWSNACTPTPVPAAFQVFAEVPSQPGPPPIPAIPPTTTSYVAVASDGNLNRLAPATNYSVSVKAPAGISTFYDGLPGYPDGTGFFYRYWPCDQAGNCATRCTATGADAPCEMRPAIVGYSCGIAAAVTIEGGSEPTGAETVIWNVTLGTEALRLGLSGSND